MKNKVINKPLFNLQRKTTLKAFIGFSIVVAILLLVVLAMFPMMEELSAELEKVLGEQIPMESIGEYFNMEALEIWVGVGAIFATVMAVSLTTAEFKNGSAELIYSLNMSRKTIVSTKLLRLVLNIVYFNVVCLGVSALGLAIFGNGFNVANLFIYALFALLITLQVGVLIFSLGLLFKRKFGAFSAISLVLIMYVLTTLSSIVSDGTMEWIGYFSPLTTLRGTVMTNGFKGLFADGILFAVWSVVVGLLLLFSAKNFEKTDIN